MIHTDDSESSVSRTLICGPDSSVHGPEIPLPDSVTNVCIFKAEMTARAV